MQNSQPKILYWYNIKTSFLAVNQYIWFIEILPCFISSISILCTTTWYITLSLHLTNPCLPITMTITARKPFNTDHSSQHLRWRTVPDPASVRHSGPASSCLKEWEMRKRIVIVEKVKKTFRKRILVLVVLVEILQGGRGVKDVASKVASSAYP